MFLTKLSSEKAMSIQLKKKKKKELYPVQTFWEDEVDIEPRFQGRNVGNVILMGC